MKWKPFQKMKKYASDQGYEPDYSHRFHHEIYLSDPRRTAVEKLRTVIEIRSEK